MTVDVRLLGDGDLELLAGAAPDLFDRPVDPGLARAFLADPRHHMAVAAERQRLVGFVSAVEYWHPDKPSELFLNEVSVRETHWRRGIGLRLMRSILDHGWRLGCRGAWVLTDHDNAAANALYARAGGVREGTDIVMYSFLPPEPPATDP